MGQSLAGFDLGIRHITYMWEVYATGIEINENVENGDISRKGMIDY